MDMLGLSLSVRIALIATKKLKKILNSVDVVRKRTIPSERPPLVGEVFFFLFGL
jgi:hypothetical protein